MVADSWMEIEAFRLLTLQTAWKIDQYNDYKAVRADISAVKAMMQKVLHDVSARALQIHGSLGTTHEMPFVQYLVESFVLGLADGPTEVHKVTLARQLLKGYKPAPDLFPSEHLLRLRAAAEAKFADRLAGIPRAEPRGAARARSSRCGRTGAIASTSGSGSARRRLCLTISDHVAVDLKHASASEPVEVGNVAADGFGVDREPARRADGSDDPTYAGRPPVGLGIGVDEEPADVDARVADRPDLPVDDGGDAARPRPAGSQPEVAVDDGGPRRWGARRAQDGGHVVPTRRQCGVDGLQEPAPAIDLLRRTDMGLVAQSQRLRIDRVQVGHASVPRCASARPRRRRRRRLAEVEQRFQRRALDERHHEQRRDVRRGAGVLPEHVRHGDRQSARGHESGGPDEARRGARIGETPGGATFTTTRRSPMRAE